MSQFLSSTDLNKFYVAYSTVQMFVIRLERWSRTSKPWSMESIFNVKHLFMS